MRRPATSGLWRSADGRRHTGASPTRGPGAPRPVWGAPIRSGTGPGAVVPQFGDQAPPRAPCLTRSPVVPRRCHGDLPGQQRSRHPQVSRVTPPLPVDRRVHGHGTQGRQRPRGCRRHARQPTANHPQNCADTAVAEGRSRIDTGPSAHTPVSQIAARTPLIRGSPAPRLKTPSIAPRSRGAPNSCSITTGRTSARTTGTTVRAALIHCECVGA